MHKNVFLKIKVIAKHLVIAFFFSSFIIFTTFLLFGRTLEKDITIINKFFVFNGTYVKKEKDIKIDKIKKRLLKYPSYGEVFGSVSIPSLDIDVSLYHGEALRILKYGLGHHAGSYFPGEGGTILIAGHNTYGVFYDLPKIKNDDEVIVKTVYGTYNYKVSKTEIIEASKFDRELNISSSEESLILYTCYPVEIPGYKSKRFVVTASLVGEDNE